MSACPPLEYLARLGMGGLEGEFGSEVVEHVAGCELCQARQAELDGLLEVPSSAEPPPEVLPKVLFAIAERTVESASRKAPMKITTQPQPQAPARVAVRCCFCHDDAQRSEAVYCATCLAPHHQDCFLRHGRCATPACAELEFVVPRGGPRPGLRRPGLLHLLAGALVAVAALSATGIKVYTDKLRAADRIRLEMMSVFVAARDLQPGQVFTEDDLEVAKFPRAVLEDSLRNTWVNDKTTILGARVQTKIKAGQVLVSSQFRAGRRALKETVLEVGDEEVWISTSSGQLKKGMRLHLANANGLGFEGEAIVDSVEGEVARCRLLRKVAGGPRVGSRVFTSTSLPTFKYSPRHDAEEDLGHVVGPGTPKDLVRLLGLKPGDKIVSINGAVVRSDADVLDFSFQEGDRVLARVLHGGSGKSVLVSDARKPRPAPSGPAPKVHGMVIAVKAGEANGVTLTVGSDDGVYAGMTFDLERGAAVVGQLEAVVVLRDMTQCRVVHAEADVTPIPGDRVSSVQRTR